VALCRSPSKEVKTNGARTDGRNALRKRPANPRSSRDKTASPKNTPCSGRSQQGPAKGTPDSGGKQKQRRGNRPQIAIGVLGLMKSTYSIPD